MCDSFNVIGSLLAPAIFQPFNDCDSVPRFQSSIHSSAIDASDPAQFISPITIVCARRMFGISKLAITIK